MAIEKLGKISRPGSPNIFLASATKDLVSICLTAPDKSASMAGQAAEILTIIDDYLGQYGSGRDRILMAQVWIGHIAEQKAFNAVWNEWTGDHAPALSIVEAAASRRDSLIEIRVYAAP